MHIIEPTLKDQTGHCFTLVNDLLSVKVVPQNEFHLWINRNAELLFERNNNVIEHRYFSRRLRRLQALWLYKRLIKEKQPFFISTSTSTDLLLIFWALNLSKQSEHNLNLIKLYVHWLYRSSRRIKRLKKIAQHYSQLSIACPTKTVKTILQEVGFTNVELIPYPAASNVRAGQNNLAGQPFEKLLYAGAARIDKGFPLTVELVALLQQEGSDIPITLQCSPTHKEKHTHEIQAALNRLQEIAYPYIEIKSETLSNNEYQQLFNSAIVLQPYQRDLFADRVSGVSLDALKAGCPLVVPVDTWMARLVNRYQAGIVVEQATDVQAWLAAIKKVIADWPAYANNASQAAQTLRDEHSPEKLVVWLSRC